MGKADIVNGITLSIVIPTYNRAPLLRFLLESIADDFSEWPADLELVVLDNASTDDTYRVLAEETARGVPVRVHRNVFNVGMDGNLAACFDAATGTYLWQIGDDEVLYRGTASFVLHFCRTREFGLLHLQGESFRHGEQQGHRQRVIPARPHAQVMTSQALIRRANVFLTFISANIVNRRAVAQLLPNFNSKAEANSHVPQMAWIYGALLASDCHYVIGAPLFGTLVGNTGGYRLVEVFGRNLQAITQRLLGARFPKATKIVSNAVLLRLLPNELMAQMNSSSKNCFAGENVRAELDSLFGDQPYFRMLVRHVLSESPWRRAAAFACIRLLNRVNRSFRFHLL